MTVVIRGQRSFSRVVLQWFYGQNIPKVLCFHVKLIQRRFSTFSKIDFSFYLLNWMELCPFQKKQFCVISFSIKVSIQFWGLAIQNGHSFFIILSCGEKSQKSGMQSLK